MKTAYLVIKLLIDDDADPQDIASECEYEVSHDAVRGTEVVEISEDINNLYLGEDEDE